MDVLDRAAARECVRVIFTTAVAKNKKAVDRRFLYVFVHEKLPIRLVQTLLSRDISLMINFSPESATNTDVIARSLPLHTARATAVDFLRLQPSLSPNADAGQICPALRAAWQAVTNQQLSSSSFARRFPFCRSRSPPALLPCTRTRSWPST
jgi:hybrid polyketide synthase / nonribosomal peptide synthetase ACE1